MGPSTDVDELERQLRHASFFVQAALEQQGKLTGKLDVYLTSLIGVLLDRGIIDAEGLASAVDANRADQAAQAQAQYESGGGMPAWPTVVVRDDGPAADGGAGAGAGQVDGGADGDAAPTPTVEVDCDARMHICQAVCCSLPFPLSAAEVEAGDVKWDLGHPYVIRQTAEGYCVHNERPTGGCDVYDKRPGVCRGYSCAEDDRIWLDFDNMVLNEEFLQSRKRPGFQFKPAMNEAVPVTISPRRSTRPAAAAADAAVAGVGVGVGAGNGSGNGNGAHGGGPA